MREIPILTFDIDWAPDFMISEIVSILKKNQIRSTWFATHSSPIIDKLLGDELFEIGIHPNFLENSTHGKNPVEVLTNMKKLFPDAKSIRTHSLFQSSPLLLQFHKFGIENDLSLLLENSPLISPFYSSFFKLNRFPCFWEDDIMMRKNYDWKNVGRFEKISGLKIFNFHPMHLFLNSNDLECYTKIKNNLGLSNITKNNIKKFVNKKIGTYSFFTNLVNSIKEKSTYTIIDLQKIMNEGK